MAVGALLEDGAYLLGRLSRRSPDLEETNDRELVLRAPITLRTTDRNIHELSDTCTIVSAGRLTRCHALPAASLRARRLAVCDDCRSLAQTRAILAVEVFESVGDVLVVQG